MPSEGNGGIQNRRCSAGGRVGLVMGAIVYGHSALNQTAHLPLPLLLNPQWAWCRAIYLLPRPRASGPRGPSGPPGVEGAGGSLPLVWF